MDICQQLLVISFSIFSLTAFVKGYSETKKGNQYGLTKVFNFMGAFVWADAIIFGLFWTVTSLVTFILKDWILFLLIQSVFWAVRSIGETIYWLNQQFSSKNINPPERFFLSKLFKGEDIWFIHQIYWQCITVISVIFSIYLAKIWF